MSRPTQKQELVRPRAHLGYLGVGDTCQKSDPMTTDEEGRLVLTGHPSLIWMETGVSVNHLALL